MHHVGNDVEIILEFFFRDEAQFPLEPRAINLIQFNAEFLGPIQTHLAEREELRGSEEGSGLEHRIAGFLRLLEVQDGGCNQFVGGNSLQRLFPFFLRDDPLRISLNGGINPRNNLIKTFLTFKSKLIIGALDERMAEFFGFRHKTFRDARTQGNEEIWSRAELIKQSFRTSNLDHAFSCHCLIVRQQWLVAELICREVQKFVDRADVIFREKRPVIKNWFFGIRGRSDCNFNPINWFQPSLFGEL